MGEAYQWLLVPSAAPGNPEIAWEVARTGGSDSLAVRASRRLRSEEALITTYSGARLRMDLDRIPLWRQDRIDVRDLWGFYSQYLYLPRLRDVSVLLAAIADGVGLVTWRQDGFAYADGYDEALGRFVGLRAGESVVLADPVGLLLQPEAAEPQLERERADHSISTADAPAGTPSSGEADSGRATGSTDETLRRFFGTVTLDPTRLSRDASEVGEAVVAHLNGLVGAEVQVTLEIHAKIPGGAPEDVVRTVTENARTLHFDPSTGFESD